jgi:hypothetical protein
MIERTIKRPKVTKKQINESLQEFRSFLEEKIEEQGDGIFITGNEVAGALDEEVREFKDAKHDKDIPMMRYELLDTMVAAFWGYMSLEEPGKMDSL